MEKLILQAKQEKVEQIAFGDLFLEDVHAYREKQLLNTGIKPIFPLWQQSTKELAKEIIHSGFKAIICCVDTSKVPAEFIGRLFDLSFLSDLPKDIDPCGENGEFHTFVYDGPVFNTPIEVETVETYQSERFLFADIKTV